MRVRGGSWAGKREHPEGQRLIRVSLPQVRRRREDSLEERRGAVSRDPSSGGTGLWQPPRAQMWVLLPHRAPAPARRGWGQLPWWGRLCLLSAGFREGGGDVKERVPQEETGFKRKNEPGSAQLLLGFIWGPLQAADPDRERGGS